MSSPAYPTPEARPEPLADAAKLWGRVLALITGLLGALVTTGFLTADQASALGRGFGALDVLVIAVVGVVSAVGPILTALGVTKTARPLVTPVEDPRSAAGTVLVPVEQTPFGG